MFIHYYFDGFIKWFLFVVENRLLMILNKQHFKIFFPNPVVIRGQLSFTLKVLFFFIRFFFYREKINLAGRYYAMGIHSLIVAGGQLQAI